MRTIAVLLLTAAVAGVAAPVRAQDDIGDPWEGTNRRLYAVHDSIDQAVLEPVAKAYRYGTPRFFRTGVSNFVSNIGSPVTLANDVLQGEIDRAGTTAARLGINSTIGVLGLFDPATDMGFDRHTEDFGQTLAVWGTPSGPFLFIPVLGPTTVRDAAAGVVDIAFSPFTWAEFDGEDALRVSVGVGGALSAREALIESINDVRSTSLDPYVSFRSSYILFRSSAIQNGPTDVGDLPEFDDILVDDGAGIESAPNEGATDADAVEDGTLTEPQGSDQTPQRELGATS